MATTDSFPALPGIYKLIFLYLEPGAILISVVMIWLYPGASWFHHELIPSVLPPPNVALDLRSHMAVLQLSNCYFLLALISSIVFRAIRDTLPDNPAAQERLIGASLLALAIADCLTVIIPHHATHRQNVYQLTHVSATLLTLPDDLRFALSDWNSLTHGNVTITLALFLSRLSWYLGIGRTRYYFGQNVSKLRKLTE